MNGHAVLVDAAKGLKEWRLAIGAIAEACDPQRRFFGVGDGLRVDLDFRMPRPKSHFLASGDVSSSAPVFPRTPDCDKLVRGVFDALTGRVIPDDSQITELSARKRYAQGEDDAGVMVSIKVANG